MNIFNDKTIDIRRLPRLIVVVIIVTMLHESRNVCFNREGENKPHTAATMYIGIAAYHGCMYVSICVQQVQVGIIRSCTRASVSAAWRIFSAIVLHEKWQEGKKRRRRSNMQQTQDGTQ